MIDTVTMVVKGAGCYRAEEPLKVLSALDRRSFVWPYVAKSLPITQGPDEVCLEFRKLPRFMSLQEFKVFMRGFRSDFLAQIVHNEQNPDFAKKFPNFQIWEPGGGDHNVYNWLFFSQWGLERRLRCEPSSARLPEDFWACGVRV